MLPKLSARGPNYRLRAHHASTIVRRMKHLLLATIVVIVVACSSKSDSPQRPFTGAPAAVEVQRIDKEQEDIRVRVYNFADKETGALSFRYRFLDKDGKLVGKVDFMSTAGPSSRIKPKAWGELAVSVFEVPAGAVKAEVLVDGVTYMDETRWKLDEEFSAETKWPAKKT